MADLRTISHEFLTEFIHMYREYPCLWKVKNKECSDRIKKNLACEHLTTKLKEIDPDVKKEKVVKKINSLRSCFRKELKRVNDSKTSGAGADDTYTPSLWYFQEPLLLTDQEVPRKGISNLESPEDTNHGEVGNNMSRSRTHIFFSPCRYTTHSGCVFYIPLSGFSLLAYDVT